ncbi:hypothetical protein Pla108_31150 [Botrimarina colliarenosi]|uniref:Uncharacterized protein n=1 Tax=Botrimarina colliarenosi TaxID=2528001 RepID=A0A5C6A7W9_9BACT|nr:hypothetical protein [Botrimarina colliarenosi]TWT96034.1 hypothetical protein Pla108_31150 [Botrimarina colliarenosi]
MQTAPAKPAPRPWYATDSGRAGAALSIVTIAVLAVGIAVINGSRSAEPVEQASNEDFDSYTTRAPAGEKPSNQPEVIVVTGTAPPPTALPAPEEAPPLSEVELPLVEGSSATAQRDQPFEPDRR